MRTKRVKTEKGIGTMKIVDNITLFKADKGTKKWWICYNQIPSTGGFTTQKDAINWIKKGGR